MKTNLVKLQCFVLFISLSFSLIAEPAEQPSVIDIVRQSQLAAYYGGDDGRSMARMMIVDANGRKQLRQFTILRKNQSDGGNQNYLVVFSRPADVRGTVFLVNKKVSGIDDRWLYLPAMDLVKRIAVGDERTSFVGAHFFYEDVSGRSINSDEHTLISENKEAYLIEHKPKDQNSVEFSHYTTSIRKSDFIPNRIEYFNQKNELYRVIEALQIETIDGIATVTQSKVSDPRDGSYTLMAFRKTRYNLGLPAEIFSERALRNPPMKWLRE